MQERKPAVKPLDRSLVNQHSFTKEELIACGMGELFGPGRAHLPIGRNVDDRPDHRNH